METAASDPDHRAPDGPEGHEGEEPGSPVNAEAGAAAPDRPVVAAAPDGPEASAAPERTEAPAASDPRAEAAPGPNRVEAAFAAPGGAEWVRVSASLDTYRRLITAAVAVPAGIVLGAFLWLWLGPLWGPVPLAAAVAALAAGWFIAGPLRRSWGYAEGRTDLYLTYGLWVRQLVVVPYGRMQVVDVTANLVEQALGIATVRVRTAATTADTRIPGLALETAVELRDRLAARSETFSTGL